MGSIKRILTIKRIIGAGVVLGIIFLIAFVRNGNNTPSYEYVVAERTTVRQEVGVTGQVKPADDVDLAFEESGTVARVSVKVGERVSPGAVLVSLTTSEVSALLAQSEASLRVEEARLAELERGSRPEEIQIQAVKVANAKTALSDARATLFNKIYDGFTKSDDAVRTKLDQFYNNARTQNPDLLIPAAFQLESELESMRQQIENLLIAWEKSLSTLSLSSDLDGASTDATSRLTIVRSFVDKNALAVNALTPTFNLSQTTVDKYKTDLATARININAAIDGISDAQEKVSAAKSALTLEENELELKKAGTTGEELRAQEARVAEAAANVQRYQAQLARRTLRSPIAGLVTKQDTTVGEIVPAQTTIVSIISDALFEVEAHVPEIDIAKILREKIAEVTLDAYGDSEIFTAHVTEVDPAETLVDGISTYRVALQFDLEDERIRSGMTANVAIETAKKENVISIPERAIFTKDGKKYVRVSRGEAIEERAIETGLSGSKGDIEIVQGVQEGETVAIPTS